MLRGFAWTEWDVLWTFVPLLIVLQVFVLLFFGMESAEQLFLSREPALLELRSDHAAHIAQELHVFLRQFPPVLRSTYRTREQQFLALQAMFPDARFPENNASPFRDALLVHVRSPREYRSLLGAVMAEQRWQDILAPGALLRLGEQVQKMQRFATVFRFLHTGALGVVLLLSCALFFSILRGTRQIFGPDKENGPLQEYLGAPPLTIVGPVAYRMTIVLLAGLLLSFLVLSSAALLLPIQRLAFVRLLLAEGAAAIVLSAGGVLLSRHVPFLSLRRAYSSGN